MTVAYGHIIHYTTLDDVHFTLWRINQGMTKGNFYIKVEESTENTETWKPMTPSELDTLAFGMVGQLVRERSLRFRGDS